MNKIIEIKFGSHLYGTNTPESDLDIKGIYIPEPRDIVLGEVKRNISTSRPKQEGEKNNKDDVDQEFFSLKEFLRLLCEGQTVALDMLFAEPNSILYKGPQFDIFTKIYENRFRLISKNVTAFFYYAKRQAAKYGVKGFRVRAVKDTIEWLNKFDNYKRLEDLKSELLYFIMNEKNEAITTVEIVGPQDYLIPHFSVVDRKFPLTATVKTVKTVLEKIYSEYGKRAILAEKNEGCDWKALSHSVRVNSEGAELLLSGKITFPRPDRELLLKIKTGQMPYKEVADLIEKGLEELEQCQKISELRNEPDYNWAENLVYEIYSDIVKKG